MSRSDTKSFGFCSVPRNTRTANGVDDGDSTSMACVSYCSELKKHTCLRPAFSRKLVRVGFGGGLSSSLSCRYTSRLSSTSHREFTRLYSLACGSNGGKVRRTKKSIASPGCSRSFHVVVVG